jgi:peroxiredoxin
MKKSQLILLFTVLLCSTAFLSYSSEKGFFAKDLRFMISSDLPDITLTDIKGNSKSIHQLAGNNKSTLFIYFNSTCHHCQDELAAISKRIDDFKNYNLILTTVEPLEDMIGFVNGLGIKDKSNVHFLLDADMKVASHYQIRSFPSIYCYNSKKELIEEYVGYTDVNLLLANLVSGK